MSFFPCPADLYRSPELATSLALAIVFGVSEFVRQHLLHLRDVPPVIIQRDAVLQERRRGGEHHLHCRLVGEFCSGPDQTPFLHECFQLPGCGHVYTVLGNGGEGVAKEPVDKHQLGHFAVFTYLALTTFRTHVQDVVRQERGVDENVADYIHRLDAHLRRGGGCTADGKRRATGTFLGF